VAIGSPANSAGDSTQVARSQPSAIAARSTSSVRGAGPKEITCTFEPGIASRKRSACSTADSSYPARTNLTASESIVAPPDAGRSRVSGSGTGFTQTTISTEAASAQA
jgi:hypothetical protein